VSAGRLVTALALVGMLGAVAALNRATDPAIAERASPVLDASEALARYGFRLEEQAVASGLDFRHRGPSFDRRLDPVMPLVAAMGASVAVADFDRDGWQDLYVTRSAVGSANALYRNRGDGSFEDVAAAAGVADVNVAGTGASMGAVWGDYDNDGYEDLFLFKYGRPELYRNIEGRVFERATDAGLPPWINANSAIWLDYDRDGWLDLFVAGYWSEALDLWHLETTRIMPESFEYAENGGRKYLLRNRGDGTFDDVTAAAGIDSRRWTLAVGAADLFGSGYPDLFLANDYGVSEVYANQGGVGFIDVSRASGIGRSPKSGMNVAFGDVFNDGRLSIYESNISEAGVLIQGNNLWVPTGAGDRAGGVFENLATGMGVDLGGWSWGAQFGDLNNDGRIDLYLANGYVSGEIAESYWYDFSEIAVGHSAIIEDAANWPAIGSRSLSGNQGSRLWLNDGVGRFVEVSRAVGATDTADGRAVAFADFGNRGVLDVVVANQGGALLLYRNEVAAGRHWLEVELVGRASNRSAIGARVEAVWDGQRQVQEVHGGSGFSAQNQRRIHYGLGEATVIDRVVVAWPSGRRQTIEAPAVDQILRVEEPD
jgi:hypothetical protein